MKKESVAINCLRIAMVLLGAVLMLRTPMVLASPPPDPESIEEPRHVQQLEDLVVKDHGASRKVQQTPTETVINVHTFPTITVPNSIVDVLKRQAIIDFRSSSDVDAGVDSIYMRGYEAKRFVTALDGLTVQKTGGRRSSNIVDYAQLPAFMIDAVEILPGPHFAAYDSKSIGGVLNLKTERPGRRDSLKPEGRLTAGLSSYNTQTQQVMVQGAVEALTYDLAYQHSSSHGHLRHNANDIDTLYGRLGVILPADGFLTLATSHSDTDRQALVRNTGDDYDADYPEVKETFFDPWQDPTWDGESSAYRLNYEQFSRIGRISLGAYISNDNRERVYYRNRGDAEHYRWETEWWQEGGKLQDEFQWSQNHTTTIGFDLVRLYDNGSEDESKTERIKKEGGYLQHQWRIFSSLDLQMGLRYEKVNIRVGNTRDGVEHIPGKGPWIERHWDQLIPKSFATWKMGGLAPWLRDTSLSMGVSKIWRAPDYHGDYNPQGRPAGAWLDPEHGIGYDIVLNRRLWQDIQFKFNYSFYDINDYIATNRDHAIYSGVDAGSLRYSDYKINLEQVHRHGIDVELCGHFSDPLSFYLTYAWQNFENQGDEPAGETELDMRAEHRVTAGLSYAIFEQTTLMLDYYYQSEEITEDAQEVTPKVWVFREEKNPAFNLFDLGLQQRIYKNDRLLSEAYLKMYVENIFDETYRNGSGYPAAGRTFGAALSVSF